MKNDMERLQKKQSSDMLSRGESDLRQVASAPFWESFSPESQSHECLLMCSKTNRHAITANGMQKDSESTGGFVNSLKQTVDKVTVS